MNLKDNQAYNFLTLLQKAVNKQNKCNLAFPINWAEIFELADAHNVYALIFEMASEFPEFLAQPDYDLYMKKAMIQIADQTRKTDAFLKLYQDFSDISLYPIVMKGITCRQLYGEYSSHRPSGDEDILIQKEDFAVAKKLLECKGYIADNANITSELLNELQEVSFFNIDSGLYIELHLNPMGCENDLRRGMNECFVNVFNNYIELNIEGVKIRTMNYTDHFLYLVLHAFRHFTSGGFGIRQALDILLFDKQYGDKLDWKYLEEKLKTYDALLFLSDLIHIGNQFFDLQLPILYKPNCPQDLLEDLLNNGVFGNTTQAQRTSLQMVEAAVAARGMNGASKMLKTLLYTIFPSKSQLLNRFPELEAKPWLLPIRWMQRWGNFFKHNKENNGNLANMSLKISKHRIELLRKYQIL